jgi:hypothetical protein
MFCTLQTNPSLNQSANQNTLCAKYTISKNVSARIKNQEKSGKINASVKSIITWQVREPPSASFSNLSQTKLN